LPDKLLFSGRAPSYKAIAICILSGDMQLRRLGLNRIEHESGLEIERMSKMVDFGQLDMFRHDYKP
jgi:hypothetical protein